MKKKWMAFLLSTVMLLAALPPLSAFASTFTEMESYQNLDNNSSAVAETLPLSVNYPSDYLMGWLGNQINCPASATNTSSDPNADVDVYKISVNNATGMNGRFAIKLENVPAGCDYDIQLYDSTDKTLIRQSVRTGTANEIIKTPALPANTSTTYYLHVYAKQGTAVNPSTPYYIKMDNYIVSTTTSFSCSPTSVSNTINTTTKAITYGATSANTSSVPSGAWVTAASVTATRNSSNKATIDSVTLFSPSSASSTVAMPSTGDIKYPAYTTTSTNTILAGGTWQVKFACTFLQGTDPVTGKLIYQNPTASLTNVKVNLTYESDRLLNY